MKKRIKHIALHERLLYGIAAIFAVVGIILMIRASAATGTQSFEAESGTTSGKTATALAGGSGGGFVTVNSGTTGGGGEIVQLPSGNPSGSLTGIDGGKTWGMVSCATEDPICIFTWQEGDMYSGSYGTGRDCGCAEIRNIQTGALIKKVDITTMPNSPYNAYRPYPIYNPFKKEWMIVTQSTRLNWDGNYDHLDRPYGFRVNIAGDLVGSAIELSNAEMRGWVAHGSFDTATRKYYVEWHQQIGSYNVKDIFATVVNEDGVITDKDYNIDQTPNTLDEYATSVYNNDTGEIVSFHSTSGENDCEDCTRYIDAYRLKIDGAGKLSKIGTKVRIDGDEEIEWGMHASYNTTSKSIVMLFREGSTKRGGGGLTNMFAMVLDGQGNIIASKTDIGNTGDSYWTSGTACSTKTNVCAGTFEDKSVYVDAASTGATKVSNGGNSGVSMFSFPSSRVGYNPNTDKFYVYGGNGYVTAPGR